MDHELYSDISLNSQFCPLCSASCFSEHRMLEHRDYNKCTSCSYMELKIISKNRILSKLAPEQLTEPFIDPIPKIKKKSSSVCPNCKNIKK